MCHEHGEERVCARSCTGRAMQGQLEVSLSCSHHLLGRFCWAETHGTVLMVPPRWQPAGGSCFSLSAASLRMQTICKGVMKCGEAKQATAHRTGERLTTSQLRRGDFYAWQAGARGLAPAWLR